MLHQLGSALCRLYRSPVFAGLVVLTLALGVGATTAILRFSRAARSTPAQFEKEIGKYVDAREVKRLWRYVTIQ